MMVAICKAAAERKCGIFFALHKFLYHEGLAKNTNNVIRVTGVVLETPAWDLVPRKKEEIKICHG
jgi:hypothetical protein